MLVQGCFDIGLPSGKSLFQLQAELVAKVQQLAAAAAPPQASSGTADPERATPAPNGGACAVFWYIMTSVATHEATVAFFEEHGWFGLQQAQVVFFSQGALPCLTGQGEVIVQVDGTVR